MKASNPPSARRAKKAVVTACVGLVAAFSAPPAGAADPAQVVAAERAFAADGAANGVKASFLRWMADEAIVFAPEPVKAKAFYAARPDGKGGPKLTWWPTYAGVSAAGDLGFTTGPFAVDGKPGGYYVTIWRKQPNGSWRWVFDGGSDSDAASAPKAGVPVKAMAPAAPRALISGADAAVNVWARSAALAQAAERDQAAAYRELLAPDARVQGSAAPPAQDPKAVAAELARRPAAIRFTTTAVQAAQYGDLAWSYGDAAWSEAGKPRRGHYVRVWRNDPDGFRIVFDELLPVAEDPK